MENIQRTKFFEFLDQKFGSNKEKSRKEMSISKCIKFIIYKNLISESITFQCLSFNYCKTHRQRNSLATSSKMCLFILQQLQPPSFWRAIDKALLYKQMLFFPPFTLKAFRSFMVIILGIIISGFLQSCNLNSMWLLDYKKSLYLQWRYLQYSLS